MIALDVEGSFLSIESILMTVMVYYNYLEKNVTVLTPTALSKIGKYGFPNTLFFNDDVYYDLHTSSNTLASK